ncbi:MAG: hypothetical protein AB7G37_13900 [Solirubrobacteraceae bacterium]
MARLAAPVLTLVAYVALLLGAGSLPELTPPGRAAMVAVIGPLVLLGLLAHHAGQLADRPRIVVVVAAAGAFMLGAIDPDTARGEAVLAGTLLALPLGVLFARTFDEGAFVVLLPAVVAVIDLVATFGSATAESWPAFVGGGDRLTLLLPSWGADTAAGQIALPTVLLLGALQTYAVRERLRPAGAAVGMTVGLLGAYLVEWRFDRAAPQLAFVAIGFLIAISDVLPRWVRAGRMWG